VVKEASVDLKTEKLIEKIMRKHLKLKKGNSLNA